MKQYKKIAVCLLAICFALLLMCDKEAIEV